VILSFPSRKKRSEFFSTNCLEKYGVSEKTLDTDTDCAIDDIKVVDLAKIIAFAKDRFGAKHHLNCGGNNLTDCNTHEKKCGSICDYCQYMEFG